MIISTKDLYMDLTNQDRSKLYVGLADVYSGDTEEVSICVVRIGIDGERYIDYSATRHFKGRTIQERAEEFKKILDYYEGCNIVLESDDSNIRYDKYRERQLNNPIHSKGTDFESWKGHFDEWLTRDRKLSIPFPGLIEEQLNLKQLKTRNMQTAIEVLGDKLFEKRELLKVMKANKEELVNRLTNDHNSIKNLEGLVYRMEKDLSRLHEIQKEEHYGMKKDTCNEGLKSASGEYAASVSPTSKGLDKDNDNREMPKGDYNYTRLKSREG